MFNSQRHSGLSQTATSGTHFGTSRVTHWPQPRQSKQRRSRFTFDTQFLHDCRHIPTELLLNLFGSLQVLNQSLIICSGLPGDNQGFFAFMVGIGNGLRIVIKPVHVNATGSP